jgi:glycosyl transferase family 2
MRVIRLAELPAPPADKKGWPWTEESTPLSTPSPHGVEWPRVTVVTPSFNQAAFIEATIRSVLLQGYPNIEYFVLDGGSTDGTVDIIKKYSPWIDFWRSESDGGQSAAINRGLNMGSGTLATWINSDDLLCKDALVRQVSQIPVSSDASTWRTVYVGTCVYVDANGNVLSEHRGRIHSLEDLVRIRTIWRSGGCIVQPEVLFPRKLALVAGGLDSENHCTMDYELWGKLFLAGAEFRYTDIPFGMFREHSQQKTNDALRQTRSLLETAAKLIRQAPQLSSETRDQLLQDLSAYGREYEANHWKATGRLAKLGLPRELVDGLRRWKALFGKS